MKLISSKKLSENLEARLRKVSKKGKPLLVRLKGGSSVLVISLKDMPGKMETDYLLASPANKKQLLKSIAELSRPSQ